MQNPTDPTTGTSLPGTSLPCGHAQFVGS